MVTDVCNLEMLEAYFTGKACVLRLATAASPLSDSDTLTTHAAVAGGGYADIALTNPVTVLVGGIPTVTWDMVEWSFTSAFDVGDADMYLVYSGSELLFEDMLQTPITAEVGRVVRVVPVYKLGNGTPQ